MWDDTLLIFTADNGACRQTATSQRRNRNRDQPRRVLVLLLLLLRGDDGDYNFSSRAELDNQQRLPPPDAPTRSLCPQPTVVWLRRVS